MHHDDGCEHQILPKTTHAHPTHFIRTFCALSRGSTFLHTLYYVRLFFLLIPPSYANTRHYGHFFIINIRAKRMAFYTETESVHIHTGRTKQSGDGGGGTEETMDFTGARDNTRSVCIVLLYITHVLYCFSPSARAATSADRRNQRYKGSEWIPQLFSQISNNTPT